MSIQRKIYEQNLKTEASIGPDHKYLGKDKKFGRSFYEKDGQLHVVKAGGTHVTNLGSTSVKGNAKMIKGLIKDHVELDEDAIDDLIARYEKTGRTAHRYPRKKRISVDGRSMSEKDAVAKMKSVLKEETELEEAVKVGDIVHLGHGTKGGTGVIGKVTKIQGSTVHIKNDNGDTFKGPLNRATVRESIELNEKIKYDPCALYLVYDGQILGSYKTKKEALRDSAGRGEVKTWCELTPKERKQVSESVELDEMRPHGMNLSVGNIQDTPSMKRYYAKLAAEREARANKPKPSDDLKGGKRPEKKLESVEHLDELKTSTIRSYVKKAQDDNQKRAIRIVNRDRPDEVHNREMEKLRNRAGHIAGAKAELDLRKIVKRESVEQVDEINRDTLTSYIGKAQGDIEGIKNVLGSKGKQGPVSDRHREHLKRELGNRTRGRRNAIRKKYVTGEEVEHLDEVSPPGFEGTVKAMKKRHSDKIDNPWALAWWMKNKGYKSHKKADGTNKEEK